MVEHLRQDLQRMWAACIELWRPQQNPVVLSEKALVHWSPEQKGHSLWWFGRGRRYRRYLLREPEKNVTSIHEKAAVMDHCNHRRRFYQQYSSTNSYWSDNQPQLNSPLSFLLTFFDLLAAKRLPSFFFAPKNLRSVRIVGTLLTDRNSFIAKSLKI